MEGIIAHAAVQQDALEVLVHGTAVERLPEIICENQMEAVVPKCARGQPLLQLFCSLVPQHLHGILRQNDLSLLTLFGRREEVAEIALDLFLLQLLTDIDAVVIKIDVIPAQAKDLGQAQAGENVDKENVAELFTIDRLQESAEFGGRDRANLVLRYTRQRATLGHIAEQQLIPDSGFQHVVQYTVDVTDSLGR